MDRIGIVVYGYDGEHARIIRSGLEKVLGTDIVLISASGRESDTIEEILGRPVEDFFKAGENQVLMFLGFTQDQVQAAMAGFPRAVGVKRPIFCGLTENNYRWTMEHLVEHLVEEKRYRENRDRGKE